MVAPSIFIQYDSTARRNSAIIATGDLRNELTCLYRIPKSRISFIVQRVNYVIIRVQVCMLICVLYFRLNLFQLG